MKEIEYCIVFMSNAEHITDFGPLCVVCYDGQVAAPFSLGSTKIGKTFLGFIRNGTNVVSYSKLDICQCDCDILNVNWHDLGRFFPIHDYLLPYLVYEDLRYKQECKEV